MTGPSSSPVVGWRVGAHYGIHVYEGDRPVATFHTVEDAQQAVADHNATVLKGAAGEPSVVGWAEHEELRPAPSAAWLLDPYLKPEPDAPYRLQWAIIDNAPADDVREAIEEAILRLRKIGPALEVAVKENAQLQRQIEQVEALIVPWPAAWANAVRAALEVSEQ